MASRVGEAGGAHGQGTIYDISGLFGVNVLYSFTDIPGDGDNPNAGLVQANDGNLYAFDAAGSADCSGTPTFCLPLWTGSTGGGVDSSPAIANGMVYVGSQDGKLYAFGLP